MQAHLQVISDEWRHRAAALAAWAFDNMVNRKDVWGQYTALTEREKLENKRGYKALTLPQKKMRGKDMVTLEKLQRHFECQKRHHLIGLHAQSAENTCRWFAVDIDLHDSNAVDAEDAAQRNFTAALGWWEVLQQRGYDPLLLDSNGVGGFHLWTALAEPAPAEDVFSFVQGLVADWDKRNLDRVPETFPKGTELSGDKLGAWLRLPGLHHTRDHITRVWSGEDWLDEPWLQGEAAIDARLPRDLARRHQRSGTLQLRVPRPQSPNLALVPKRVFAWISMAFWPRIRAGKAWIILANLYPVPLSLPARSLKHTVS
ncbi:MAG: TOTE conflict system archaeo-eukaryotic primase domain-containing protein [Roseimicrobium sp.]